MVTQGPPSMQVGSKLPRTPGRDMGGLNLGQVGGALGRAAVCRVTGRQTSWWSVGQDPCSPAGWWYGLCEAQGPPDGYPAPVV